MTNGENILSQGRGNERLSEEKLLAYLEGKLSPAEQHEVETWLANEGMESDAVDGLRQISAEETKLSVTKINHTLRQRMKNKRNRLKPLYSDYLTWVAIALVLLLAAVAYIVIRRSI